MKLIRSLVIIIMAAWAAACSVSPADIDANIDQAERELREGRPNAAFEIGEDILQSHALDRLSVGQLCALAHLYAELSARGIDSAATRATAAHCLEAANAAAPDSVAAFMRSLPLDEQGRLAILDYLAGKLETRRDTVFAQGDTITIIEDPHEQYNPDSL